MNWLKDKSHFEKRQKKESLISATCIKGIFPQLLYYIKLLSQQIFEVRNMNNVPGIHKCKGRSCNHQFQVLPYTKDTETKAPKKYFLNVQKGC